jgi:hypothetical protein
MEREVREVELVHVDPEGVRGLLGRRVLRVDRLDLKARRVLLGLLGLKAKQVLKVR